MHAITNLTPDEIKADHNFLCGLELKKYDLNVYLTYQGTDKVIYNVFKNGTLLFTGNDFRPSPLHSIDNIESMTSLLGFLTVQKGDVEEEYFKNYTPAQIEWSESQDCELLKVELSDYENEDSDYYPDAAMFFENQFIQG